MVSKISGIRNKFPHQNFWCGNKSGVRATEFIFGGRRIAFSFLKGEALGFHIYGPRYKELSFSKTYQGLPLLLNLVGVLGGGGYLIVVDNEGKSSEYIIGFNGSLLKRWREKEIKHTVLAKVGDTFFHEVFPEIEPTLRFLRNKFPKEAPLGLILKTGEEAKPTEII